MMVMTLRTVFSTLLFVFVLLPLSLHAQSNRGIVTGTVTDAAGAPLPGVQVVDPALQRGTTTRSDGSYRLTNLPVGDHTLEFRFVGYQTAVREVTLAAGESVTVNVSAGSTTSTSPSRCSTATA